MADGDRIKAVLINRLERGRDENGDTREDTATSTSAREDTATSTSAIVPRRAADVPEIRCPVSETALPQDRPDRASL